MLVDLGADHWITVQIKFLWEEEEEPVKEITMMLAQVDGQVEWFISCCTTTLVVPAIYNPMVLPVEMLKVGSLELQAGMAREVAVPEEPLSLKAVA